MHRSGNREIGRHSNAGEIRFCEAATCRQVAGCYHDAHALLRRRSKLLDGDAGSHAQQERNGQAAVA